MIENVKSNLKRVIVVVVLLAFVGGVVWVYKTYHRYFKNNVVADSYLHIRSNANFAMVVDSIKSHHLLKDTNTFISSAIEMNYVNRVAPGRYHLKMGMGNRQLINMLISANQEPVKLSFQNIRLKSNFAAYIAKKIEADSMSIISLLDSAEYLKSYNFNPQNVYTMFLPNSYELYWNTSAKQFFEKMNNEYKRFWSDERLKKAESIGLTPVEVSVLASIVDAEALVNAEMPIIAGLYLNRLKKGMKLESDPTVIFAVRDFSIRRVLNKHLKKSSPYNTYQVQGLPPGPIMMPSVKAIDAVLNYKQHNYIYMCAKEDFSGYHNFAIQKTEHIMNATKFQQALNQRNIKK